MGCPRASGDSGAASATSDAPRHRRRGLSRRAGLAALALIAMAPAGALAADMPDMLRGSYTPTYTRWDGFYFGAQGGETFGSVNFGNATQSMVSYMLANNTDLQGIVSDWTALQKGSSGGASYGGFVGYNWQWDDVILGAELNYSHMSIGVGAQNSVGPIPIAGAPQGASTVLYSVTLTSAASLTIHDIMTARARAGWTFDRFMPYAFAGVAVGRADISSFATLAPNSTITVTPPGTTAPLVLPRDPQTDNVAGLFAYGFTVGLGIEAAVVQNLFVRAEWEFIEFPNVSNFRVEANSMRVAVGVKF